MLFMIASFYTVATLLHGLVVMLVVRIDAWKGRDAKRKLMQSVSSAVAEPMCFPVERVHVIINEQGLDNLGLHGEHASRIRDPYTLEPSKDE